jgi:hypothetical protein
MVTSPKYQLANMNSTENHINAHTNCILADGMYETNGSRMLPTPNKPKNVKK